MTTVQLGVDAFNREYSQAPEVVLLNRFFEKDPSNQVEGFSLLARPGNSFETSAGAGPIRLNATQAGSFDGDLFFVSGEALYRYNGVDAPQYINGLITGNGQPSHTFVSGAGYEHFFIADGATLQYYDGLSYASGTLTLSGGSIIATETVMVDAAYYEWTAGDVDLGAPVGTVGDPYLVALGASDEDALENLLKALNLTGIAGTDYSTNTQLNVNVEGFSSDDTTLVARARERGVDGNAIPTTETGANLAWADVTLVGGGAHTLNGVVTPDDVGIVSLATLGSFVLAVQSLSQRFYWLQPGAVVIDALDFAEAESEPDQIIQVTRVGDVVYMVGQSSTEVWYATGTTDPNASPFQRQQGLAFSQGGRPGTVVRVRTQLILVAEDGIVYQIVGGPQRISTNGIEERIRIAHTAEQEGS
jgi:hypothetical protein